MIFSLLSRLFINVFGYLYPAFLSFKALRNRDGGQVTTLLVYWLIIGLFTVFESFADALIFWFPFYSECKALLVLWLLLPQTQGALYLYRHYVHRWLLEHEPQIDTAIEQIKTQTLQYTWRYAQQLVQWLLQLISTVNKRNDGGPNGPAGSQNYNSNNYNNNNNNNVNNSSRESQSQNAFMTVMAMAPVLSDMTTLLSGGHGAAGAGPGSPGGNHGASSSRRSSKQGSRESLNNGPKSGGTSTPGVFDFMKGKLMSPRSPSSEHLSSSQQQQQQQQMRQRSTMSRNASGADSFGFNEGERLSMDDYDFLDKDT